MSLGHFQELVAAIVALSLSTLKSVAHRGFLYLRMHRKMVNITELPVEVLAKIFSFVPPEDHASMAKVCRIFRDASQMECLWIERCQREYNVSTFPGELSYKDVYTKLLYKYGSLIGIWQPEISFYGGLVQVQFENGMLTGSELLPPLDSNIKLPLRNKRRFILKLDENNEVEVLCVGINRNFHKGAISKLQKNIFTFKCHDKDSHACSHQGLIDWLEEESLTSFNDDIFPQSHELLLMKYLVMCQYNYSYKHNRVFLPKKKKNVPIQPGLFKGTYGAHGLEIIMLDYEDDGKVAKAVKISGDPNVPAGKVTFMAELEYSMVLTAEEQVSMSVLEDYVTERTPYDPQRIQVQPFRVPPDCLERFKDVPKTCIGRYSGTGQIAGHGFTNPSFTNGQWIIFSEDLFGVMWLDLLSFSMFHRVQEELLE